MLQFFSLFIYLFCICIFTYRDLCDIMSVSELEGACSLSIYFHQISTGEKQCPIARLLKQQRKRS